MQRNSGLHEVRTRVVCHLPVNNLREEAAFFDFKEYLDALRYQDIGVSGYTHSQMRPSVYHGFWWPENVDAAKPVHDSIVLCTIDYLLDMSSRELSDQVRQLKQTIRRCYSKHHGAQEEIWVVAYPILRQD